MDLTTTISFTAAALCAVLAGATLVLKRRLLPWLLFAFGMLLLAADAALGSLIMNALSAEEIVAWQKLRLLVTALLPGTWLAFSLCYSRGNYREFFSRWRMVLVLTSAIPLIVFVGFGSSLIRTIVYRQADQSVFTPLGFAGKLLHLILLLASVLILLNFERTFRSAVGIMRWRIKFFVLGVVLLFAAKIYLSSQVLLYSGIHAVLLQINGVAILGAALLISYSLLRTKLVESEIYPSHQVLHHSLTAVLAGVYLACLGLFANWVSRFGDSAGFPLKALLLMAGIVGLSIAALSDRLQQKLKLFVSRHFQRPVHDYRRVWSLFTERIGLLIEPTELCRAAAKAISETFELLSVTIWLVRDHDHALVFGASTSLTEDKAEALALDSSDVQALLQTARTWSDPIDIDHPPSSGTGILPVSPSAASSTGVPPVSASAASSAGVPPVPPSPAKDQTARAIEVLNRLNPDYFHKGGNRVCVPLVSGGELVGLITVADRVNGVAFSGEDLDLLKCIGEQVAGSLRNIQLSQRLMQNKEMEAFQTMSAFFVHDLKNTASTLSLMLQNLTSHFGDPEFRDDCLRGLTRSVTHINDLIQRLALLRHELEIKKTETDLNSLISATLKDVDGLRGLKVVEDFQVLPPILADSGQLKKVLTNLLLNAKEAVNGPGAGEVRLRTAQENGWVLLSVADNGCGMSEEFLRRSLFRPFQTTKKSGLGIGMFHSKAIVEAHQGRIEVESKVGHGTTFRVLLPGRETAETLE